MKVTESAANIISSPLPLNNYGVLYEWAGFCDFAERASIAGPYYPTGLVLRPKRRVVV